MPSPPLPWMTSYMHSLKSAPPVWREATCSWWVLHPATLPPLQQVSTPETPV